MGKLRRIAKGVLLDPMEEWNLDRLHKEASKYGVVSIGGDSLSDGTDAKIKLRDTCGDYISIKSSTEDSLKRNIILCIGRAQKIRAVYDS